MQIKLNSHIHSKLYLYALMFTAGAMTVSVFLLSVALFILLLIWLLECHFKSKFLFILKSKKLKAFLFIYIAHIIWLFNTSDFNWAVHDLRIKLPLIVLPVIISTSPKLSLNNIKCILLTFILGLVINTFISTSIFLFSEKASYNFRDISILISHIRFSIMIVISIACLFYFIFSEKIEKISIEKKIYLFTLIWFFAFLFILKSLTGILMTVIVIFPVLIWLKNQLKNKFLVRTIVFLTFFYSTFLISNLIYPLYLFYREKETLSENYDETINGNQYIHFKNSNERENGHLVWSFICNEELEKEWDKRSQLQINDLDKKGSLLKITLIRYLSSRGYTKDSLGISKLKDEEIKYIENGIANHILNNKSGIYSRIYEIIWALDKYKNGIIPNGNSIIQRVEYFKTGMSIIKDNFLLGVGTGDVPEAFQLQYEKNQTKLKPKARLRTHNQFLTFFICFGVFGFILVSVGFFYPIYLIRKQISYFTVVILLILFLSMLNEDTLETHIGVSLFAFYYSLFVYGYDGSQKAASIKQLLKDLLLK